ncbi:hypothetical protein CVU37_14560 [candidate division BRC1 bacterium HGW-BRC1-1]|jgi:hypothetical protein|nr:MAG: hypothetical protein CVU37_14560 [candidate division BRC1 bacterium HGW-BRC1-1]
MKLVHRLALGAWCAGLCAGVSAQFDYTEATAVNSLAPVPCTQACAGGSANAYTMGVDAGSAAGNVVAGGVIYYAGAKATASISVPVVGAPPPWLTAAVAVDTYMLPKYYPMGCTPRAVFTQTDFNSAPRLLHYKNYLAPMPYTHPPVAAPADMPFAIAATDNETLSQLRVGELNLEY